MSHGPRKQFKVRVVFNELRRKCNARTPHHGHIHHPEAGLTLLELTFAAAIMASTLVFILGSIVSLSVTSDIAADQAASMAYAASIVEELRRASEDELLAYAPPEPPAGTPNQSVEVSYVLDDNGGVFVPPGDPLAAGVVAELPNPLHVNISITAVSKSGRPYTINTATVVRR